MFINFQFYLSKWMVIVSVLFQLGLVTLCVFIQNKSEIASLSQYLNDCPISVVSLIAHILDENRAFPSAYFCTFLPLNLSWWVVKVKMPVRFRLIFEFTCTYAEPSFVSPFRISICLCVQRPTRKYLTVNVWIRGDEYPLACKNTCLYALHTVLEAGF